MSRKTYPKTSDEEQGLRREGELMSFSFRIIAPANISSLLSKLPDRGRTPDSFPLLASLRRGSRAFPDSPSLSPAPEPLPRKGRK